MDKMQWVYGFLSGIIAAATGSVVFIAFFTPYHIREGVIFLQNTGMLGRLIKIGALLDLGLFFLLLRFKKETMAKGVIVAVVFLAIMTFFV